MRVVARLEGSYDAVLYFCAPAPLAQLRRLAAAGKHPKLEVHPLPGLTENERGGGR